MSRLDLITDAVRPKLAGRALFQGPQGSGKTWTMLNVARLLAGPDNYVIGIDTEKESMLTYADVFRFKHLPWRPPYDPGELTVVLDQLATKSPRDLGRPLGPDDVVVEVGTRKLSRAQRELDLAEALAFARLHFAAAA